MASLLLYEIQDLLYYGSDATALLEGIAMTRREDGVRVRVVKYLPPPPTTKS